MSFVSSKGNILCRLKIELYKIFAIINRAIKGLHCTNKKLSMLPEHQSKVCLISMSSKTDSASLNSSISLIAPGNKKLPWGNKIYKMLRPSLSVCVPKPPK